MATGKGAFASTYDNGTFYTYAQDWTKTSDFTNCHFTCRCDRITQENDYAGLIVYDIGKFPAKKVTGNNIYPGWILITDSEKLDVDNHEDQVHGALVYSHFEMEPSKLTSRSFCGGQKAILGGFSIR